MDRINVGRLNHGSGGFGSSSQPQRMKPDHRARDQRRFGRLNSGQFQSGRFNSDTHGCRGIQSKSCSSHGHCAGCLGLYTCHVDLGKCQMKGLSQKTESKFFQTLNEAQHR
ncbi:hypothetical protein DPEC_G00318790 [Dallia pectoralis]|uniref:Uncharacterized protein n=1 Tax=Dallia pectoralis TaxID=75939 RepID=A0ACC2F9C7_DALPE|nr:hypothetical protein DPEC_G00318790 [Dallia pectoralis]